MSNKLRRFEVLLPTRFNDGSEVADALLAEALDEIIDRFGAVFFYKDAVEGYWHPESTLFRADLGMIVVDVPKTVPKVYESVQGALEMAGKQDVPRGPAINGGLYMQIQFDAGTLVLQSSDAIAQSLPGVQLDPRTNLYRAEARHYRAIIETLRQQKIDFTDAAREYQPLACKLHNTREPFPHQKEALATWWNASGRGVVVLPTGTGKTLVALLAIAHVGRPTLVVTPTIPLMNQWYGELLKAFYPLTPNPSPPTGGEGSTVGLIGSGSYDLQPLTVTTYDSAYIHLERWGNRYGLLVFDECHHLPSPSYQFAAVGAIAPYRLGLTATPERADGNEALYAELIGPIIYRREIKQLAGDFLAEYRVERIDVDLTPEEKERYDTARAIYRQFVRDNGISMGSVSGWQRFLQMTFKQPDGRAAFQAYREQKRISLAAPAKINLLDDLLHRHALDRVIIFTYDNASVYEIARRFLVPAITHQTKTRERQQILERFHSGAYNVVVTSQVLNEGVDVPAASVGIILSGTGSVREHVQRLGRLLRKHADKQALLYEVVTRDTGEEYTAHGGGSMMRMINRAVLAIQICDV